MRLIASVIIMVLIFTGTDAARHVFGATMPANSASMTMMGDMDCCPPSQHADHSDGKKADMKCGYCCAAVIGLPHTVALFVPPVSAAGMTLLQQAQTESLPYGLFRPPRRA